MSETVSETDEAWFSQNEKDDWQTPEWLVDAFDEHDPIDVDPCAGPGTNIGEMNLTVEHNGLVYNWWGVVYVNPPFSEKVRWLQEVVHRIECGEIDRAYVLTPDSTDTKSWWHDLIAEYASYVWFPRGRVKFYDPREQEIAGSPTFGSAVSCFGAPPPEAMQDFFRNHGWLVQPA